MEKLFGLDMNSIAGCLGSALAIVVAVLGLVAWRARVMFKLGLRPIPRRRAQSALIVLGLMLATLIITAAFVTGDTLSHTVRSLAVEGLGEIDEVVRLGGGQQSFGARSALPTYFKYSRYDELAADLAGYKLVDMVMPAIRETIPVVDTTRQRSEREMQIIALRPEDAATLLARELFDAAGNRLELADLGPHEVVLNAPAAKSLNAAPGDRLDLYASADPTVVVVRAVVVSGDNPNSQLIMPLKPAQALFNQRGNINAIVVSNVGDAIGGARVGPEVTAHLRGLLTDSTVAGQIFGILSSDPSVARTIRLTAALRRGSIQTDLLALADGLEAGKLTTEIRSLLADEGLAADAQNSLADAGWRDKPTRDRLASLFDDLSELGVDDVKRDTLDTGELAASAFTTIFVVTGLFSISAGLLLIFLIFVMLAAERKSEMGMTRAVGAQRSHLVEMFVFEGTAYDIAAAAVGVAMGVLTGLVIAATLGKAFAGETDLVIRPSVTLRSLVVSYTLGMLVTFGTVLFSAYRVSRLNIVAAIRDLPEPPPPPIRLRDRLFAPVRLVAEGYRFLRRGRVARAVWTWLVGVPIRMVGVVWAGFVSGPLTLALGLLLVQAGFRAANAAPYSLGVSFVIVGFGLILRGLLARPLRHRAGLSDRIAFTVMGLGLAIFWSLPFSLERRLGVPEMTTGPEMFFISGTLLVAGTVMVVMYNTDLLLGATLGLIGGSRRLAPVLRMAIAYPLSNRFRTGLTVAMFAIIVFSVIFMATLFKVNETVFANTEALTGGFNVRAESSRTNPVSDLAKAIAGDPHLRRGDYEVVAAESSLPVELRQGSGRWSGYVARGVDEAFLDHVGFDLAVKAEAYKTAADVWRAVRDHPGYAVIDRYAVPSRQSTSIIIGGPDFQLKGVYLEDETMRPVVVQVREPRSEATFNVTIVGVLEMPSLSGFGLYVSQATLDKFLPFAVPAATHYIRLAEGVGPQIAGPPLERAFLKHGLESIDQVAELKRAQASQRVIEFLLQGFLTLGLVVGVAALGVISTRAVVERRQQIGMLRALGFRREMIAWSFMIESSFVALLGIGMGAVLALIPAYHMINDLAADIPGIRFQVPWGIMSIVVGLAYGMALLMTWLPASQASRVTPAEALRYE